MVSSLVELHKLIAGDKELSLRNLDEKFLIKFLRATNFDARESQVRIKCYFKLRLQHPELFHTPSEVQAVHDIGFCFIYPHRGPNGELMMSFRPGRWDPTSEIDAIQIIRSMVPHFELLLDEDEELQKKGVLEVMDPSGVGWRHAYHMTPSMQSLLTELNERGLPLKFNRIHIVNANRIFIMLWNVMKWLMGAEMRNRIVFHSNLAELGAEVPAALLPEDLGGTWKGEQINRRSPEELRNLDEKITQYWQKYPATVSPKQ